MSSISIYTLGGNDTVTMNTPGLPANIDVGDGNNTITVNSANAATTITAGSGNDTLTLSAV